MLKGGILKYQSPTQPIWKKGYVNTLESTGVDYNKGLVLKKEKKFSVPAQPKTGNYYGGVTNELIQKNWNPEILQAVGLDPKDVSKWPSNTPQLLQQYIETKPELISQLHDISQLLNEKTLTGLNEEELTNLTNSLRTNIDQFGEYKGFKFKIKEEQTLGAQQAVVVKGNKRHYAVAVNRDGVEVIKSDYSFTLDPNDLVDQLKLIIDQQNLQG